MALSEPGDIHQIEPDVLVRQTGLKPRQLTLLAGGPPCQPFSKSAYWSNGHSERLKDPRAKTLQAFINIVNAALPYILLLENVNGLAYTGKDEGIRLLQRGIAMINHRHGTRYALQTIRVNAADYGVPRFASDCTFSQPSMVSSSRCPSHHMGEEPPIRRPFATAWDSIGDLGGNSWPADLDVSGRWARLLPSIPEGRNYLWHTPGNAANGGKPLFGWRTRFWSFLLKLAKAQPSWTIQAAPGPATGPFHWQNRLLSIEEMCRLQTFPLGYAIVGSRRSAHRQVGNAVPSAIGELFGLELRRQFLDERVRKGLRLIPDRRLDCPPPKKVAPVPSEYLNLCANHHRHPGTGLGPAARRRAHPEIRA